MGQCLFIRNDDVWTLDQSFKFFFDAAIERRVPVIHAVIPGRMDKGLIEFLRRAKEKSPQLLDIVQHGWMHTNHSKTQREKYEFGASRSMRSQREDIERGSKLMRQAFGNQFTTAFVPPFHGFDNRTFKALEEKEFLAFSAGNHGIVEKSKLLELPAHISFTVYEKDGSISLCTPKDMIETLIKNFCCQPLTGIVTHHEDFKTVESRKKLLRFFDLIDILRKKNETRVFLFSDLLSKKVRR